MKFKLEHMREQLDGCPAKLQEIALYMDHASRAQFGKELVITRVTDGVPGESGVHQCHRAFDARIEYATGHGDETAWYYTEEEAAKLAELVNTQYPRTDKKLTCMVHRFKNGKLHFHVQIMSIWANAA